MKNFNKLKNDVYNLGLSSANISKIMLAKKIQRQYKKLKIEIVTNRKDPDKRKSFMIGDKISDKKCADKSKIKFYYATENFKALIKKII